MILNSCLEYFYKTILILKKKFRDSIEVFNDCLKVFSNENLIAALLNNQAMARWLGDIGKEQSISLFIESLSIFEGNFNRL